ncbi:MAG: class I SAM-dependent methyltransferase [Mycobacterium sp.]|nr:class I SAM-dependent methyltransferase [Mycobacterium sp.]
MNTRWNRSVAPRGDDYDARWTSLADSGQNVHGEADLIEALLKDSGGTRVLDAGCGTGRVAIELTRRGFDVIGIDADPAMLATARAKAPGLAWVEADLAEAREWDKDSGRPVDLVALAGNVMIFLEPGTESLVLSNLAGSLTDGGFLVAGFALQPDRLTLRQYDEMAEKVGLLPVDRFATWDRQPFGGGDYAVSVHRKR